MSAYAPFDSSYRAFQFDPANVSVRTEDTPQYSDSFWRYVTSLTEHGAKVEARVLSKASGAAGLYLVPSSVYARIMKMARAKGTIARLATEIVTDAGGTISLPDTTAHGSSAWLAENASYSASDDTFGKIDFAAYKAATFCIVSEELLLDSEPDIEAYLAREFADRIALLEGPAFISGDGSGKPTGVLSGISTVTAPNGSTTTFTYSTLVDLVHSVPVEYREPLASTGDITDSPSWIVSDGFVKAVRKVVDSAGAPIFRERTGPAEPAMLLGYPVYVDPNMATPGANAKSAMFGNWKLAYVVRRVRGLAVQRLDELYAVNGQVGFRGTHRVDGKVVIADAARALQHSAT